MCELLPPGQLRRAFADLAFWPWQVGLGLHRVSTFNSLGLALQLTLYNLLGIRRLFRLRLYQFEVWIRSGTPDLVVAMESLGSELEIVTRGIVAPDVGLIVDAGGYIGTSAIKFATAFPACRIVSIEPSSENLAVLRRNIAAYSNISVVQAALAATDSGATLRPAGGGEWGYTIVSEPAAGKTGPAIEQVATTTVDEILRDQQADRLFILKLDVEGAELEILQGGRGWMPRTDIVIAELHEKLVPGVEGAFAAATTGRANRHLPGEKLLSLRPGVVLASR